MDNDTVYDVVPAAELLRLRDIERAAAALVRSYENPDAPYFGWVQAAREFARLLYSRSIQGDDE